MPPIISVNNLSKIYTSYKKQAGIRGSLRHLFRGEKIATQAVQNINFSIDEGELVGFLGPNGAGKTTTLKMLSGIIHPTNGEAKVLGFTPWERKTSYLKQISLVMGQKAQLWWDLPGRESFLLTRAIYEIPDNEFNARLKKLSTLLKITKLLDVPVRQLSLGERMKMELINALLHNPRVLFLDEPTIGLDVVAQKIIRDFLKEFNHVLKTTILLTSHYMEDVEALCRRVIVINQGVIIYDGLLETLVKKYARYKILKLTFLKEIKKADLKLFGKVVHFGGISAELQVSRGKSTDIAAEILKKLPVDDILIDEVGVNEVVRSLFSVSNS
ncbi:MAG: hypothetical protein A2445_01675 [Candidatus Jacksonbacteria bacterium RIFOXYC2_FULL_44_29]|nr:MAG: hypothetical protein UV19_C0009G0019 [Parcubacteria group bacterium GW2011_GWA2_42_28]KKT52151.1 MAG: hypothetical protein UW45_C0054G0001 [Parcubacteria group bacterium GW2011_GWC2_44_22]OGY75545.1 MAG: hypothetical protein A2295_02450 [Candidatus Jacksonbacteria bacterium RIFOXYB2_FULL_44_15]OGY75848.1 MAG: hypothetical protein A2240_01525 [Candidatus Jacksonbacteria bacterium RIFOXYA2_FULL_43_12]OGY78553.1 MAG: hypothetical protein A2445_01675 [Candidatus Jacksonbacteria bacterium RI